MVKIIDKRDKKITTFGELKIGQFFIDSCNKFILKVDNTEGVYIDENGCYFFGYGEDDCVTSVEVEINIIK